MERKTRNSQKIEGRKLIKLVIRKGGDTKVNIEWLSDLDKKIIEKTGYGARRGLGKRPALIIIDAQNKFVGLNKPILESINIYPLSIGEKAVEAAKKIKSVLDIARNKSIPIFYLKSSFDLNEMPFISFAKKRIKHEESTGIPNDQNEIIDLIKPMGNEYVVHKRYPSGFFGTPIMTFLNTFNRDTLIVTGFVTSGCVRAFVVDAFSYNFNVAVIEDCVQDRFEFAHNLSLIDMNLKYADVVLSKEIIKYLESI